MTYRARVALILGIGIAGAIALCFVPPIAQPQSYHDFADGRSIAGIPNFWNVISNFGFVLSGMLGFRVLSRRPAFMERGEWIRFAVVFTGMILVGLASSYYHWAPTNDTIVLDRMSLTINLMGVFGIVLYERMNVRLFFPLIVIGAASVLWWRHSGDLRVYGFVQFYPVIAIPLMIVLLPPRYSHSGTLAAVIGWYALAKVFELTDRPIYEAIGFSGHTLKHLVAGAASFWVVLWLHRRKPLDREKL